MNIFLTGSSGFVGSFLLKKIIQLNLHKVTILVRKKDHAWRIQDCLDHVSVIESDLATIDKIEPLLVGKNIDTFAHLGWVGVGSSDRNSSNQWRNIPLSLELLELASRLGVKNWIGLGSQAEYGPFSNQIDEETPTKPTTLYGASKLATCTLAKQLCAQHGIRFAWLRLFSSFGPMDNDAWLIPYLIKSLLEKRIPELTAAEQMWDYIYVDDVADAIYAVLENQCASGIFNLGSGNAYPLKNVILKIRDYIDPQLPIEFGKVNYRPDQIMYLRADINKLEKATGWTPKTSLDEGLKKTVASYRKNIGA